MARKTFAVVDVAEDRLHTMESAENAADLEDLYPPGLFTIWDMDGRGDIPFKTGATIRDLTIDAATGEWTWKLTDLEIEQRDLADRHFLLRKRILHLMTAKEMADTLGPEYIPVAMSLQDQIIEIQNEIGPL